MRMEMKYRVRRAFLWPIIIIAAAHIGAALWVPLENLSDLIRAMVGNV